MHIGYWWESQKERDHQEEHDVCGCTILKWILDRMQLYGLDRCGSEQGTVDSSCEHGNELLGSIKYWEILE
jgi:hypothetical protein